MIRALFFGPVACLPGLEGFIPAGNDSVGELPYNPAQRGSKPRAHGSRRPPTNLSLTGAYTPAALRTIHNAALVRQHHLLFEPVHR